MSKLCFVTTCMGRLAHLRQTLPLMVAQPDCTCVVVDYSCPEHCGDWVEAHHPGVRVVRVADQATFNAAFARNAGAGVTDTPWLCFVDADICLHPCFAETVLPLLQPGHYYRCHPIVDDGTCGTFLCERESFSSIGGYDDVYQGWGREDVDVFWALGAAHVKPARFPSELLRHIGHSDDDRTRFHRVTARPLNGRINLIYHTLKFDIMRVTQVPLVRTQREGLYNQVATLVKSTPEGQPLVFHVKIPNYRLSGTEMMDRTIRYEILPSNKQS